LKIPYRGVVKKSAGRRKDRKLRDRVVAVVESNSDASLSLFHVPRKLATDTVEE
jgi:hypothetical protein